MIWTLVRAVRPEASASKYNISGSLGFLTCIFSPLSSYMDVQYSDSLTFFLNKFNGPSYAASRSYVPSSGIYITD